MNERRKALRAKMLRETMQVLQTLLLAAVIIIFSVINLVTPAKEYSAQENRNLAQRPALNRSALKDGSYFSDMDTYYADQFFLRDKWVSLQAQLSMLLGRRELNGVYIGAEAYLLSKPETPAEGQADRLAGAVNAFAEAHPDLQTEVMLVPDAAVVLKDKLPQNAPVRDQMADIQEIEQKMDPSVKCIDAAAALLAHKDEPLYYHTDHHWTSLGARYVFEGTAAGLGISRPLNNYQHYVVSDTFEGTLAARSGLHRTKDEIEVYTPEETDVEYYVYYPDTDEKTTSLFNSEALNQKDQYTVFFGGNHPLVEIHTTADTDKSLLIFKDSYANSFVQFLYPYYENIIMIDPRYYYDNPESVLKSQKITDVLILYSADTVMTDTALADCLNTSR